MIGLEDRQSLAHDIHTAHKAGARLRLACETAGIDVRTLQRWNAGAGLVSGDGRLHAPIPGTGQSKGPANLTVSVRRDKTGVVAKIDGAGGRSPAILNS